MADQVTNGLSSSPTVTNHRKSFGQHKTGRARGLPTVPSRAQRFCSTDVPRRCPATRRRPGFGALGVDKRCRPCRLRARRPRSRQGSSRPATSTTLLQKHTFSKVFFGDRVAAAVQLGRVLSCTAPPAARTGRPRAAALARRSWHLSRIEIYAPPTLEWKWVTVAERCSHGDEFTSRRHPRPARGKSEAANRRDGAG